MFISGTLDHGEKGTKLKAQAIAPMVLESDLREEMSDEKDTQQIVIVLSAGSVEPSGMTGLRDLLHRFPGPLPVCLRITVPDDDGSFSETMISVDPRLTVDGSDRLIHEVQQHLGKGSIFLSGQKVAQG